MTAGEELAGIARSAVDIHAAAYGAMGVEAAAWLARVEAEAARLQGDAGARAVAGRRGAAFGFGHVYEEARSRWRLAEALLATGDRAGAAEQAAAAHEVAVRLGAAPLRTAVEALVRRGRLDVALPGVARPADAVAPS